MACTLSARRIRCVLGDSETILSSNFSGLLPGKARSIKMSRGFAVWICSIAVSTLLTILTSLISDIAFNRAVSPSASGIERVMMSTMMILLSMFIEYQVGSFAASAEPSIQYRTNDVFTGPVKIVRGISPRTICLILFRRSLHGFRQNGGNLPSIALEPESKADLAFFEVRDSHPADIPFGFARLNLN